MSSKTLVSLTLEDRELTFTRLGTADPDYETKIIVTARDKWNDILMNYTISIDELKELFTIITRGSGIEEHEKLELSF